jgi:hypothetical protein
MQLCIYEALQHARMHACGEHGARAWMLPHSKNSPRVLARAYGAENAASIAGTIERVAMSSFCWSHREADAVQLNDCAIPGSMYN